MGVSGFLRWMGGTGLDGIDGECVGGSPLVLVREGGVADLGRGGGLPGGGGFALGLGGGITRLGRPGFEGLSTGLEGGSGVERCRGEGTFLLGSLGGTPVDDFWGGGWDGGGGGRFGG